ncbi:MAG: hypothetical protein ABI887_02645 [Burkholderiales bacterium]
MLQVLKSQLGQSMSSVRQFLQKPIRLDEGGFTLGASESSLRAGAREKSRKQVRHMKRDLHALLSQHPTSRQLMRHLAAVERTLRTEGLAGFEALPVRVVATALTELERLVWDWSPTGLAELRSRMAVIVKNRPPAVVAPVVPAPAGAAAESAHADDDFSSSLPADVSEVDHTVFEEMERSWVGFVPAARAPEAATA